VIDGGHWHFSQLTHWYYGANRTGLAESTLYLSATVPVLVGVAVAVRNRLGPHAKFWLVFAAIPAVFCLGPQLVIGGSDTGVPLPFALLKDAIPPLQYNLEPERIIVMTTVAAGVLAALVLSRLDLNRTASRLVMGVVCAGLALELWPGTSLYSSTTKCSTASPSRSATSPAPRPRSPTTTPDCRPRSPLTTTAASVTNISSATSRPRPANL
jgi:hypothetical protein